MKNASSYWELHFVVLLLGFTGILGKLIELPTLQLVISRMVIAFVAMIFITKVFSKSPQLKRRLFLQSLGVGIIVAAHWLCFFQAIKISNVSIALGLLGTGTLFMSFLEPLFFKKRIQTLDLLVAIIILAGIYLIFSFETTYFWGIIMAISAYFLSSLFSVLNKKLGEKGEVRSISRIEMGSGLLFLIIVWVFSDERFVYPRQSDWVFLIILGVICTAYAFTATLRLMQKFSAYLVVLHINLEPIYAIILAYFIFGESEKMTWGFYVGSAIVSIAVFYYTFKTSQQRKKQEQKSRSV